MNGYNPSVQDRAGDYIAQGIRQFAGGLQDGMDQRDRNLQEIGHLNAQAQAMAQTGQITKDDLDAFASGNLNKKREIVSQTNAAAAFIQQQKQWDAQAQAQQQQASLQNAHLAIAQQQLKLQQDAANWQPGQPIPQYDAQGNTIANLVPTSPKQFQAVKPVQPQDQTDPSKTKPLTYFDKDLKKGFYYDTHFGAWKPASADNYMNQAFNGTGAPPDLGNKSQPAPPDSGFSLMHPSTWFGDGKQQQSIPPKQIPQPIPMVGTKAAYDQLPSGSTFKYTDGTTHVKP